jgi:hypothetical protein
MQEFAAGKFHFEPPSSFSSLDHLVGDANLRVAATLLDAALGSLVLYPGRLYDWPPLLDIGFDKQS